MKIEEVFKIKPIKKKEKHESVNGESPIKQEEKHKNVNEMKKIAYSNNVMCFYFHSLFQRFIYEQQQYFYFNYH